MFLGLFMAIFGLYLIKDKWLSTIGVILFILGAVIFILSFVDLIFDCLTPSGINRIEMDVNKLERANILAKSLIPKVDELLNMSSHSRNIAHSIYGLSECDEEFKTKFKQLLNETKQRFQKEFDEL